MKEFFSSDIRENKLSIFFISLLHIIKAVMVFSLPVVTAKIMKGMITNQNILILFGTVMGVLLVEMTLANIQKKVVISYKCKLNEKIYKEIHYISYETLVDKGMIYYLEKVNLAVANYASYFLYSIPAYISVILTLILSIILIGIFNFKIAIGIIVIYIIQIFSLRMLNNYLTKRCVELQNVCAKSFSNILSVFNCIDYFKQLSTFNGINKILQKDIKKIHRYNTDVDIYARNISSIINATITNLQFLLYILCGYMMINSKITGAEFVYIIMLINICFQAFSNLSEIQINKKDYNASYEFLQSEIINKQEGEGHISLSDIKEISLDKAQIAYGEKILINDINFTLQKGDIIFLSGETGTGKSSLLKILLAFYKIDGVKINGIDIRNIRLSSLREKITYVSQNNSIVQGSVFDNIFMGESSERIDSIKALPFLAKFMNGNNFSNEEINANGTNLSGGDKQKLAISRIFASDSELLILDEITSSMDDQTTDIIFSEIVRAFQDKIIIIVSHNNYIKKYANRFLYLSNGLIVEGEK